MSEGVKIIKVIDSHTAGEPTRVVVSGAPDNPGATPTEWREFLRNEHDWLRTAVACEPRGHEAMVGAFLCEPTQPNSVAGVVFFNNIGYLHGCIHGTIGVTATLAHLGRLAAGDNKIETPTGIVTVRAPEEGWVTVQNVRSYRHAAAVPVEVPGWGTVHGDVAWGGNWFFLIEAGDMIAVDFSNLDRLTDFTCAVRKALEANGITGEDGGEIDHIEVFGPPANDEADSKNFVLCPGNQYDRSPCGTGTSAKIACLLADKKLAPREIWRQESIVGSVFQASGEFVDGQVIAGEPVCTPSIRGTAYITSDSEMVLQDDDPFRDGIS